MVPSRHTPSPVRRVGDPDVAVLDPVGIDHGEVRAALAAAAGRTASLLRTAGDGTRGASGLAWTVGEVGAHMAVTLLAYTAAVDGRPEVVEPHIPDTERFSDRLSAVTSSSLAVEPERDPAVLADLVVERMNGFLAATAGRPGHERVSTDWYRRGASLSLATATGLLLGEQVVHGYDIARSLGRPWPIDPVDARLVIAAIAAMMPLAVDPDRTAGVEASFGLHVRGGPRFGVHVERGTAAVGQVGARPIDCHISADPVAFLLVAYGRVGQWGPIARGRLLSWGRKPWLALRFKGMFFNP